MAGHEMDTEKLAGEPVGQGSSSELEKPPHTPDLSGRSLAVIRSVQHSFGNVSSASVRLYRHTWPKVSSASVRLKLCWLSAASFRHASQEPVSGIVRLPYLDCLEFASISLRLLQWMSSLYVFICVTESFRSKITYDGRVRQIQPIMLTTLIYSSLAIVRSLLLILLKMRWPPAWYMVALCSVPWDVSMICLFIAKVVIFGVHSFECAASQGTASVIHQYGDRRDMDALDLRNLHDSLPGHEVFIAAARDVCLVPSGVYVICGIAALSYVGSAILAAGQLLKHRRRGSSVNDGQYPRNVEQAMPVSLLRPPHVIQRGRSLIETGPPRSGTSSTSASQASGSSAPWPSRRPPSQDPKYANLPAGLVESMAVAPQRTSEDTVSTVDPDQHVEPDGGPPRTSQETTISMDADQYMVSDGFRSCGRPPSYTSSRESSQGPPEYRSRPPSLHTVVLVGP